MIITLKPKADESKVKDLCGEVLSQGFGTKMVEGAIHNIICVTGSGSIDEEFINKLSTLEIVNKIQRITVPYKLVAKESGHENKVKIIYQGKEIEFGNGKAITIAGPCSVESKKSLFKTVQQLSKIDNLKIVRAGAFKPRTSPYAFQGLGEDGLKILAEVCASHGMLSVSEMVDTSQAELFERYVDLIQIGARNMYNYELLKVAGQLNKPIILKRGFSASVEDFLCSAEYIASRQDVIQIILCLRGVTTFDKSLRNTPDIGIIPVLKEKTWLPVIFDPSHATGRTDMVSPMAMAAIAAGADGLIIEVHHDPHNAKCDAQQTMSIRQLKELRKKLAPIAAVCGKHLN